ncbi:MAG: heparinase II/III family protein [Verrucomicrobia bacterium]|nr:heparinase II/III family protein [Verrucomicrobiota bacterium]
MRPLAAFLLRFALPLLFCAGLTSAAGPDPLAALRAGHPRLLLTEEQLSAAVAASRTDPVRAQLHARILATAEAELTTAPIKHVLVGPRLLDKSRTCVSRVLTCALAYRLSGDERFFRRARQEMLTAAAFPDWNPSHFLDVAEMSFAVAVGYDWLFPKLTAEDRATLKAALLKHGLALAPDAYNPAGAKDPRVTRWVTAHHNWNQVCNGGLLAAALALAEEEPALARLVVTGAVKSLPLSMAAYAPDGAYPEGPGYWNYGTTYNVIALALLETALGTDFNLGKTAAFDRTATYRLHVQSPTGLGFNYADGASTLGLSPAYTWLGAHFGSAEVRTHCRTLLTAALATKRANPESDRFLALHVAWFPVPVDSAPSASAAPLDARFRGPAELALFRSAWNDPRALFVGFKAGRNDVNHSHLDLGSFVLDADGVRWAADLGPDDYNLPGYFDHKAGTKAPRWKYYRLNNRSHNTLTPGDALQEYTAAAPLVAFASTPARAFAVADLTAAYPAAAQKILRGVALLDRSRVLVQDDVTGLKPGTPLVSRFLTDAKITLSADARTATLVQNGRTLRVELLAPAGAKFTTRPATPALSTERQNAGTTALSAEVTPTAPDTRIALLLTPVGDHWPAPLPTPALTALADWK